MDRAEKVGVLFAMSMGVLYVGPPSPPRMRPQD